MADLIGQKLGQYEITAKLGSGGMATVYKARQVSVGRNVAIKVIESRLADNPEFLKRFEREARTIAMLNHPHILKLFDFGRESDLLYLVMELQPGGSLADLISKNVLPLEQISKLLEQIASALDYAHEQGIIHRDLKPQNVLLDTKGNAILTDFGIAKVLSETTALTASGLAMGTPAYMSPEQCQGLTLDARADIYSLGIMLFEMLTGEVPFKGDTPVSMIYMHLQEPPPPVTARRANLPKSVEKVIEKALAKNPVQRFQSAGEFAAAFKTALTGQMPQGVEIAPVPVRPIAAEVTAPRPTPLGIETESQAPPAQPGGRTGLLVLGGILLVAVLGVLAVALSSGGRATPATAVVSAPTAAQTESAPPTYTPPPVSTTLAPSSTPVPPTLAPSLTTTGSATTPPTWTTMPTLTLDLARRAAATIAARETATANAVASYTRTPTPNEEQTLAVIVGATETALALASSTKTPTPSLTATYTATFTPTFTPSPVPGLSTPVLEIPTGATLTIWCDEGRAPVIEAAGRAFQAKYNVPVRVQTMALGDIRDKFKIAAAAGQSPDIIIATNDLIGDYYANGLVSAIDLGGKAKDFDPVALRAFTYDSKLLGVPYGVEAIALYYNKALLPTPPKTWAELKAAAKILQAAGKVDQGFAFMTTGDAYGTYPLLTGFGGYLFGRDKAGNYDPNDVGLDSPGAIKAAQELDAMVKAGLVHDPLDYDSAQTLFVNGKLAMWISGPWALDYIKSAGLNYGIVPIPRMAQVARPFVSAQGLMVSNSSQYKPLAKAFLTEFIASPDVMTNLFKAAFMIPAFLPAREAVSNADMEAFVASVAVGDPIPFVAATNTYWWAVSDAFTLIYQQKGDPAQVMRDAATIVRDAVVKTGK